MDREQSSRSGRLQIAYAFDSSFKEYFGEKGVAAVEQALEILRKPRPEMFQGVESAPLNFPDPLRLEGMWK